MECEYVNPRFVFQNMGQYTSSCGTCIAVDALMLHRGGVGGRSLR